MSAWIDKRVRQYDKLGRAPLNKRLCAGHDHLMDPLFDVTHRIFGGNAAGGAAPAWRTDGQRPTDDRCQLSKGTLHVPPVARPVAADAGA